MIVTLPLVEPPGWARSAIFEDEWVRVVPPPDVPTRVGEERVVLTVHISEVENNDLAAACRAAEERWCNARVRCA